MSATLYLDIQRGRGSVKATSYGWNSWNVQGMEALPAIKALRAAAGKSGAICRPACKWLQTSDPPAARRQYHR